MCGIEDQSSRQASRMTKRDGREWRSVATSCAILQSHLYFFFLRKRKARRSEVGRVRVQPGRHARLRSSPYQIGFVHNARS